MKSVIILGSGPSRVLCPYDDEVWGVNNAYKQVAQAHGRMDKIFIVHKQVNYPNGDPMFDWEDMNKSGCEIISLWEIPGLKAIPYPYERIFAFSNYMTDTIAYMIAYAIDQEYEKIRLYGIDMKEGGEYYLEKGGIEFWLGVCKGKGIEVEIAPGSTLMRTPVGVPYATIDNYDAELKAGRKVKMEWGLMDSQTSELVGKVDKVYVKPIWG